MFYWIGIALTKISFCALPASGIAYADILLCWVRGGWSVRALHWVARHWTMAVVAQRIVFLVRVRWWGLAVVRAWICHLRKILSSRCQGLAEWTSRYYTRARRCVQQRGSKLSSGQMLVTSKAVHVVKGWWSTTQWRSARCSPTVTIWCAPGLRNNVVVDFFDCCWLRTSTIHKETLLSRNVEVGKRKPEVKIFARSRCLIAAVPSPDVPARQL